MGGSDVRRLLLVDDDEVDRIAFRRDLGRTDVRVEVIEARSVGEGKRRIDDTDLDWIVVDYRLPDGVGTELVRYAHAVAPFVPAIVLTGTGDESLAVRLIREGARDYIPKAELNPGRLGQSLRITAELAEAARSAEQAHRAQQFLAGPGAEMLAHMDHEDVLRSTVETCAGAYSDVCIIDLLDETGTMRRAAAGFADESLAEQLRVAFGDGEWRPLAGGSLAALLETGRVTDIDPLSEEWKGQLGPVPDDDAFRARSATLVPLRARGRTVGLLTLMSNGEGRHRSRVDPAVAEVYGSRIAMALDNARLYDEVKRAVAVREEVLAIVAHDLRNLLHTIKAGVHLLLDLDLPRDREVRHLHSLARASDRMNHLIADLLDSSRLEAGLLTLERAPLAPGELVREAAEQMRPLAEAAGIRLEVRPEDGASMIPGDRERLLRVLFNLIGNAIRYTPRDGRIVLSAETRDDGVRIGVADQGPGIPEDERASIFTPFWQSNRRSPGGVGLGLAIAAAIVDLHGGDIQVDSEVGRGTTFWIELPGSAG